MKTIGTVIILGALWFYNYCTEKDEYGTYKRAIAMYDGFLAIITILLIVIGVLLLTK